MDFFVARLKLFSTEFWPLMHLNIALGSKLLNFIDFDVIGLEKELC